MSFLTKEKLLENLTLKSYYFFVKHDLSHMNTGLNPLLLNIS